MATNDPKSRLTEGTLNSPAYTSPNGVTDPARNVGATPSAASTAGSDVGRQMDETPGEKIGRFFRRAMDRLSGRDEDLRRGDDPQQRDRETQERYRSGDSSGQYGRSSLRDRGQSEWSDLGRSRDDRNFGDRGWPGADTGRSSERSQGGSGSVGYGQGQGSYGQGTYGQSSVGGQGSTSDRDSARLGSQGSYVQGPSFDNRTGQQSLGQRAQGRSSGESERGSLGERDRDDWTRSDLNRDDWNRGDMRSDSNRDYNRGDWNRDRWGDRSMQSGATGMSPAYAGSGGSHGSRDEQRSGEGELGRDRDRGQGRRFWQREPLAARDVMTRNPKTVTRQSSIREAAIIMRDENCGVVPVVDAAGRLEGILTDRDVVVRGLVTDNGPALRHEDVMTDDVSAVTEDEPLTSVLDLMGRKQIRRVPVVDRDDRLLGIISMADIANRADYDEDLQDAFERISSRRSFWSLFS